jgi:peptidoglycan/LPS O-acetylase OafA/YrhL
MPKPSRIPELDGLRGVAILLVIFYHYTNGIPLTSANGLPFYVQRGAAGGWTGVDLFFVLSGFLIGGILIDARGSSSFFSTFYLRRVFRIMPIYYLWIALYVGAVALFGAAIQARSFSAQILPHGFAVYSHFLFLQNFLPLASSPTSGFWGSWFGHLWSLAVEEQFYLAAPLMIAWLSPRRLTSALIAIVCCAPIFRTLLLLNATSLDPTRLMPARADALALGMLAAIAWRSNSARNWLRDKRTPIGVLLCVLLTGYGLLCRYAPGTRSMAVVSFGFTWIGIFYALLLMFILTAPESWIAQAMRTNWLRNVGRVSYCMYVIHLMVSLLLYVLLTHARPQIQTFTGACVAALAVIVTYGVACASWIVLEEPLLALGHRYKYTSPDAHAVAAVASSTETSDATA